jgi:hypothetical protein
VAVDADAVDFLDVVGEELGDVLIGGPVDRNAEVVAVFLLERRLQVFAVEPVLAEPVEVRELLVGQLVEIAVRAGGELGAHEVIQIEPGLVTSAAVARHPVGQVVGQLQPRVGADQVAVVDIGVVEVAAGLHLGLHGLHHLALAEDLVVDLDAGDFLERLGEHFRLVGMRRNTFGQDVDFHSGERLCRIDEPLHLGKLLVFRQNGRLEFLVDPFLGRRLVGKSGPCPRKHGTGRDCAE